MITNAVIGTRVRFISTSRLHTPWYGKTGTIINSDDAYYRVERIPCVQFDEPINFRRDHYCSPAFLELEALSPEEEDQRRRQAHAMKYL